MIEETKHTDVGLLTEESVGTVLMLDVLKLG